MPLSASRFATAACLLLLAPPPGAGAVPVPVATTVGDAVALPDGLYWFALPDGTVLTTHGPDPKHDAGPVAGHGRGMQPGDPERPPVCALDFYQHVLYARLDTRPSRLGAQRQRIRSAVRRMNHVLNEAALRSGGRTADFKVKCDATGQVQVDEFVTTSTAFDAVVMAARRAGFTLPNVNYSIFLDAVVRNACGFATTNVDDRLSPANLSSFGGGYALTYEDCWNGKTPMHEAAHNMGAVQASAPASTGSGHHCNEIYDVMCYIPDGGNRNQTRYSYRCLDEIWFDCGDDTYFDAWPEYSEYLAGHWNLGSSYNRMIALGPKP